MAILMALTISVFAAFSLAQSARDVKSPASTWQQLAKLTASDGEAGDQFGSSVAISGSTVVVALHTYAQRSVVYLFEEPAGGWTNMTQTAELSPSDGVNFGEGASVAIDGNTAVVGSYDAVYVYVEPATGWTNMTETAKLTTNSYHYYGIGYQVAISGNTILTDSYGGRTYVYVKPSGGWTTTNHQNATLIMPYGTYSLAISDNGTVVLGADAAIGYQGSAFVFLKPQGGWNGRVKSTAHLVASDPTFSFGYAIAIDKSGDTIAVSSYNGSEFSGRGWVYVFDEPSRGWGNARQNAKLRSPDNLGFGQSVALREDLTIGGDPLANIGTNQFQGAVYGFVKPQTGWHWTDKPSFSLIATDGAPNDQLGSAAAMANGIVIAGAPNATIGSNSYQGAVYVFGSN